ncbi:DEAD/DEAH box helicase [Clostridia bacterium]|nr:DEAD/DEAH box helicase [Clostridia bacterium]
MASFDFISEELRNALSKQNITEPTPIQEKAIPLILSGKSAACASETGTGKTLAYLLPIFQKIDAGVKLPQAFVITPTRELAAQVFEQAQLLNENYNGSVTSALLIGGANANRQIEKLKEKPKIIIGSAGRVNELIEMKKLSAHAVKTIVLDEADKLLDANNAAQIKTLVLRAMRDVQILAFSASVSEKTAKELQTFVNAPIERVFVSEKSIPDKIEHFYIRAEAREKFTVMRKFLFREKIDKAIIFVNNPFHINQVTEKLNFRGLTAVSFSGGANKTARKNAIAAFRDGAAKFLVTSDALSRGLDIKDVSVVVNFDAPELPSDYLHRVGRAGRLGGNSSSGFALTIVSERETAFLNEYEKAFNITIKERKVND